MKILFGLLVLGIFLIAPASAYSLYMDAPSEINVGQSLKVMGNSSLAAGTSFDLVLYYSSYTTTEIERRTVTLQDYNDKTFVISFSTRGLKGGMYKVEVQSDTNLLERLSSDSITLKLVNIIDRSGEITITSPATQDLKEALRIEGSIAKLGDSGVKIEVRGPEGPVFGPTWVETKKELKQGAGEFIKTININMVGDYDVSFSDAKGYIGIVTFHVNSPTPVPTTSKTSYPTQVTTRIPTTNVPTQTPTPTKSPQSISSVLLGLSILYTLALLSREKTKE
jgi:hypothetical protein